MTPAYRSTASVAALVAAAGGLAYSVSFVIIARFAESLGRGLSAFLMGGGLLTIVVAVALFHVLRETDAAFALLGLLFASLAGLGAAVHGAHDLAILFHPPAELASDLPNEIDPRGFLTFGVSGAGVLIFSWLVLRGGALRPGIGYLGYVSGALLVLIWLARLIILSPSNPLVLLPAAVEGFIVNPVWYVMVGLALRRPG